VSAQHDTQVDCQKNSKKREWTRHGESVGKGGGGRGGGLGFLGPWGGWTGLEPWKPAAPNEGRSSEKFVSKSKHSKKKIEEKRRQ